MKPLIEIRNLEVRKNGTQICAVAQLDVQPGERMAVIGPNGSGKTTLLRVMGSLEQQYTGQCRLQVAKRQCVYVHQAPYLLRGSVLFNATYGLAAHQISRHQRQEAAHRWLARLGIDHLAHRPCHGLSGGEKRRLALVRALAIGPQLLLLDEPFADLDPDGIQTVCEALEEACSTTIVVASPAPLPDRLGARLFSLG
ncbi:MAG: ATP-binding cassette domain-containing protein [Planctomycetales bacterium]|nr:ATP-binding cassette domain-containing protein [Planctomycetales bacterium]NIM07875.1 ATP-binding cassette domain-containing protein [Planctomycetales bacterium]NIN07361.1 ATP-binding cassette domain-containing protein [Planctomycetales bacterium]NIN76465.1 ATP-binding cassette domain-containing protein [Planctomycetales bacterium]NIO33656.1 ATP-binding cassette domain-containing protein [Planctomycetales bacterium]